MSSIINLDLLAQLAALASNADLAAIQGKIASKKEQVAKLHAEIGELEAKAQALVPDELKALLTPAAPASKGKGKSASKGKGDASKVDVAKVKAAVKDAGGELGHRKIAAALGVDASDVTAFLKTEPAGFKIAANGPHFSVALK